MNPSNCQRIAAQNFLSNISLDGSHSDTTLSIFLQSGYQKSKAISVSADVEPNQDVASGSLLQQQILGQKTEKRSCGGLPRENAFAVGSPELRAKPLRRAEKWRSIRNTKKKRRKTSLKERLSANLSSSENVSTGIIQKITNILVPDFASSLEPVVSSESLIFLAKASIISNTSKGELRVLSTLRGVTFRNERELVELTGHHRARLNSADFLGLKPIDMKEEEISYSPLLVPYLRCSAVKRYHSTTDAPPSPVKMNLKSYFSIDPSSSPPIKTEPAFDYDDLSPYDSNILDDPEFGPGKHRTTLTFSSYLTSVVDYVNPAELKKEINEKFKAKFPDVQISYSKFKSIKKEMKLIAKEAAMDFLVLAQSYVFFEKLVLKCLINKPNRKLVAGCCLLLAAKLNDFKRADLSGLMTVRAIADAALRVYLLLHSTCTVVIESTFRVSRREMLLYELPTVVALEFSLHLPDYEILPHYQKLLWFT